MSKQNERIQELETDIKDIKDSINDPDIPEETKNALRESLVEMESELEKLKVPKEKKPKKEKQVKPEYMFGDKPVKESAITDMQEAWNKRRELSKSLGGKVKTKSVFSRNGSSTEPQQEATAQ